MRKKGILSILIFVMMLLAVGCSKKAATTEELVGGMKEFFLPDNSASMKMKQDWVVLDDSTEYQLVVGAADDSEVILMMQFPKSIAGSDLQTTEDMKALVEEGYETLRAEAVENFNIPGMTNVSATRCELITTDASAESCIIYGETEYALYAIIYSVTKWDDTDMASFQASCSTFKENQEIIKELQGTTIELTDTIRWFNATYAVLTQLNGLDYNLYAGLYVNEITREMEIASLEEWWGVTDRASAEETLLWALEEGHRASFAQEMKDLEGYGLGQAEDQLTFLLENFDMTPDEAEMYLSWYKMYEEYGANAIDGWDYCRAMNLLSFYYLAGYYTEQEVLEQSLEIAKMIQPLYESWDELIASYLRGYEYWAEESSEERRAVYEELKQKEDSPYNIDFKMELVKTW